jgi:hypothetical protein
LTLVSKGKALAVFFDCYRLQGFEILFDFGTLLQNQYRGWGIFMWPQVGDFGWPSGIDNSNFFELILIASLY